MKRANTVGKSRFSRALLSLSSSLGSGLQGLHVGGLGSLHLRGVLGSHRELRVEDRSNSVIDRSYGQPGVRHPEAEIIRHIFHSLEVTVGVNIGVGSLDPAVGVPDLLFGGVDVGVTVVQVTQLVLSVELTPNRVWSRSSNGSSSRSSSVGHHCLSSVGKGVVWGIVVALVAMIAMIATIAMIAMIAMIWLIVRLVRLVRLIAGVE